MSRHKIASANGACANRGNRDIILREDQREFAAAVKSKNRADKKALAFDTTELGDDLHVSGRFARAAGKPVVGYGRRNPNARRPRR